MGRPLSCDLRDRALAAVRRQPDITLEELRALLAGRGVSVAVSTLWRFFDRREITLKKRPGMPRSRSVPTS
jgi:transposase